MNRNGKKTFTGLIGKLYCLCIYIFLFLPIVVIAVNSFNATTSKPYLTWKGFTLKWYVKLFENEALLQSFQNTMVIALCSTILATVVGTLAAVGMYKYKFKGKSTIDALLYIPVVIPEIVLGIALLTMFAKVSITRGIFSMILAHATFSIPYVIFNIRARLSGYDNSIEEASMDLGANKLKTFCFITLPVLAPGIAGGSLLAFTLSIDDVIVSYFVNGQTMTFPLMVMEKIKSGVSPDVNALSVLILLGTTLLVVFTQSGILQKKK